MTALVGPNGAGKTTLMRCIAGLETPLSGAITVAGIDVIAQPRESHRQLGFLADSFGVSMALSVRQTLSYAALAHGATPEAAAAAVPRVAKRLGLTDLLDRPCGALSRGQRQRVAIGQALIHRPQLLILDEPASGLDPEARAGLAALFRSLRDEGMTLLVSSHILAELDEYSTHMLMLRDGRVVEHRALAAVAVPAVGERAVRRLRIGLLTAAAQAQAWLAHEAGLRAGLADAHNLELAFSGTDADQAALLARLIGAGFAVSAFAEQRENLQQSYLRSVAGVPANAGGVA
ncbi:ABC transporter ATP-binding protein [Methylibium sp.]|uniref:ABC transporter ATP-binding protein n=1 Tax=Methylibium sp. TaxID=2067992 RepID=UPI003D0D1A49